MVYDTLGGNFTSDAFRVLKQGGWVVSISGEIDSVMAKQFGLNGFIRGLLVLKRRHITKAMKRINGSYRFLLMSPSGRAKGKIMISLKNSN